MADLSHIARPYAEAIFELAREDGKESEWYAVLAQLADSIDEVSTKAINDPLVSPNEIIDFFQACLGENATETSRAFLECLAEHDRFMALPAIFQQFDTLKSLAENKLDVVITAASELSQTYVDSIVGKLKSRFNSDINIHTATNSALIAGAMIEVGDLVIDGSVRGKLERLAQSVLA